MLESTYRLFTSNLLNLFLIGWFIFSTIWSIITWSWVIQSKLSSLRMNSLNILQDWTVLKLCWSFHLCSFGKPRNIYALKFFCNSNFQSHNAKQLWKNKPSGFQNSHHNTPKIANRSRKDIYKHQTSQRSRTILEPPYLLHDASFNSGTAFLEPLHFCSIVLPILEPDSNSVRKSYPGVEAS